MASADPKRAGVTLKNFFAQNSSFCAKTKIYEFLTFMQSNVVKCS